MPVSIARASSITDQGLPQVACLNKNGGLFSTTILLDSQTALDISENPANYRRAKHIDICYHAVRHYIHVEWMLGHEAEKTAHEMWEQTKRDIVEKKPWTPRDWGKGIDLNLDEEDGEAKLDNKDVPVHTESAELLSAKT